MCLSEEGAMTEFKDFIEDYRSTWEAVMNAAMSPR